MQRLILALLLVGVLGGAWFFFALGPKVEEGTHTDPGPYAYRCGDGSEFYIDPTADLSALRIIPATSVDYVPNAILLRRPSDRGVRFEGSGIVFTGRGEIAELSSKAGVTQCSAIVSPDESPFNFGG